jgi:hypothetical protein
VAVVADALQIFGFLYLLKARYNRSMTSWISSLLRHCLVALGVFAFDNR